MSVIDIINTQKSNYSFLDREWEIFVIDHKDIIKANSRTYTLSADVMSLHKYNLERWLRYETIPQELISIVLFINDIDTNMNFINITDILVPDLSYIISLYTQYQTTKSKTS